MAIHWVEYSERVKQLEAEGLTTSDAQSVVDVEFNKKYGVGWDKPCSCGSVFHKID